MLKKNWKLERDYFNKLNRGSEILEIKLASKTDKQKTFNLIFNGVTLLRIERKKISRTNKKLLEWAHTRGDLVTKKSQNNFRRILELNKQITDEINSDSSKPNQTPDKFDDVLQHLQRRKQGIEEIQQNFKIDFIKKDKIGYCGRCNCFRQTGDLTAAATTRIPCPFCSSPITMRAYHSLPPKTERFLGGTWFEEYIAKRLHTLGWTTFTDIYVYGNSGAKFEIDILAAKNGRTLLVECKTGPTGLTKLSSFIAKFSQIRTTSAAFITLEKMNEDDQRVAEAIGQLKLIEGVNSERGLLRRLKQL